MASERFARLPAPPYFAVVFSSTRADADPAYNDTAARMEALAALQPGFLGIESCRDADGFGITVSYWRSEQDILAWKRNAEHAAAREKGRTSWYKQFELRIARVERAYGGSAAALHATQPMDAKA
ncbi:antibiotic biosynthesis monooxygenase [soil metagenome]